MLQLVEFLEQYDPPGLRLAELPPAPSDLTSSQVGVLAEDELGAAILVASFGSAAIGIPVVDRGFDSYVRRVRTMKVIPIQAKARRTLRADGGFVANIRVASVRDEPSGYLILAYLQPPELHLYRHIWVIPIPYFLEHCPRSGDFLMFESHLDGSRRSPWNEFLLELSNLGAEWLFRQPGWTSPPALTQADAAAAAAGSALGGFGELWVAAQLEMAGGNRIAVARERVDVDVVDLIVHDLRLHAFTGLQVKTSVIDSQGVVQFHLPQSTFFIDDHLLIAVVPCTRAGSVAERCLLIPSAAIPSLTSVTEHKRRLEYLSLIHI